MRPTLSPGDLVIFRRVNPRMMTPSKGNIVLINHPLNTQLLIIKRIYGISANGIEVRGDNELVSTDSRQFGLVHKDYLYGIAEVVLKIGNLKFKSI